MNKLKKIIWHPFFFATYPILALLANNLGESRILVGIRALIFTLISASILLVLQKLVLRNWYKAAILCSLSIILFFSYGQVYNLLKGGNLSAEVLGRHRILFPLYAVIFFLGFWLIIKKIRNPEQVTEILNIVGLIAVAIPFFQIIVFQINSTWLWSGDNDFQVVSDENVLTIENSKSLPDVYYIVLDAYARGDTMQEFYGFNNESFLTQLEELGFYVADCSQSNYAKTRLSLASTLNMNYLEEFDEITQDLERGKESRIRMGHLIRRNAVRRKFQELGYSIVAFETGYLWSEWDRADIYLSQYSESAFENIQLFGGITDFEALLLETSISLLFMDAETVFSATLTPAVSSPRRAHYDFILYTLNTLESAPLIESPKFVFAHLISPHGPYVFDAEGNFIPNDNDSEEGYIGQVKYLNTQLIPLLQNIIEQSEIPPIIILQADHGGHGTQFNQNHRMNVLNAYFLPEDGTQHLYESISPVNSFRIIFDTYFGTDYGTLSDVSYYSSVENFFDFEIVPNLCESN